MKRCLRTLALVLVACLMLGVVASAAGRTISGNAFGPRGIASAKARAEASNRLLAMIDKGIAINGVKNARPLIATPGAKASSLVSFNLNPVSSVMSTTNWYSEGYTNLFTIAQPLMFNASPADATINSISVETSNYHIVDISGSIFTMNGNPWPALVTGTQSGTAKITVTIDGIKATKNITVKNGFIYASSISLYEYDSTDDEYNLLPKKKTIYTDEPMDIAAIANPYNASFASDGSDFGGTNSDGWFMAVNCTSSKESVAVITSNAGYDNYVFPVQPGSANITVRATDGGRAVTTLPLTVKGIPVDDVEFDSTAITMQQGTTRELDWNVEPSEAWDKSLTWSTTDKKVATVDAQGNVTAVGGGNCTIRATNKASGEYDTLGVTVSYKKSETPGTDYRFFGIGNSDYLSASDLPGCANDLAMMVAAYGASGATTQSWSNETASEIQNDLDAMATGAGPEDVTIFYYSGHGAAYPDQSDRGALVGTDGNIVTVDNVQARLDKVPGTVVVILDSCLSGQFITSKSTSPSARIAQANGFNQAWISKLSSSKATNFSSKALTGSTVKSKYKILTAAAPMEVSWGGDVGWFSYWMGTGIGLDIEWSDAGVLLPITVTTDYWADVNGDDVVTLNEAYNYVKAGVASETDAKYRQTTSVWPVGDKTAIFNATT